MFARQLHRRKKLMEALRTYAEEGGKILAECGGMMFLTRSLTARQGGTAYAMTGILPLDLSLIHISTQRFHITSVFNTMIGSGLICRVAFECSVYFES